MNKLLLSIFLTGMIFGVPALRAEDGEVIASTKLSLSISTLPEAKLKLAQSFVIPFLRGESVLTRDNNLAVECAGELTPVSMDALTELVWTPAAFLQLTAGGQLGSGWNMHVFGMGIRGIGLNVPHTGGASSGPDTAFEGLLWNVKSGAALQFDLAAVFPGDWHHVIFQTYHEALYTGYSRAGNGDSWFFENDEGENRNGWNYYGRYILAYQMPLFLDTIALQAEMKSWLYDTPGRRLWGDELGRWFFSAIFNFKITGRFSAALITQCRTVRNFTPETEGREFYQDRRIDSPARRLAFYRAAAIMTYVLK